MICHGLYDRRKAEIWLILLQARLSGRDKGLTSREIAYYSGLPLHNVRALLSHWYSWERVYHIRRYIIYHPGLFGEPGHYLLAARGRDWLVKHYREIPTQHIDAELPVDIEQSLDWLNEQQYQVRRVQW